MSSCTLCFDLESQGEITVSKLVLVLALVLGIMGLAMPATAQELPNNELCYGMQEMRSPRALSIWGNPNIVLNGLEYEADSVVVVADFCLVTGWMRFSEGMDDRTRFALAIRPEGQYAVLSITDGHDYLSDMLGIAIRGATSYVLERNAEFLTVTQVVAPGGAVFEVLTPGINVVFSIGTR